MTHRIAGFGRELTDTAMGREMLARDWGRFAIGAPDAWPLSLRALVSAMLACPTPMFMAWGEDLNALYNDAYRPILGHRASDALGQPFRRLWADIWDDIGPLVDRTLAGESSRMIDMKLDIVREGHPDENWWTFSYSPVHDEAGAVVGLFCVTGETTDRVIAERDRDAADERLQLALSAGNSIGVWDWDVTRDLVAADARFAQLYGLDPDAVTISAPIGHFFGGIHPDDRARVQGEIEAAMAGSGIFSSEYRLLDADGTVRWVSAQGRCIHDDAGRCVRLPGVSFDITRRVEADSALRAAKEERDFVIDLTRRQRSLNDAPAILDVTLAALATRLRVDRAGFYRALPNGRLEYDGCWSNGQMPLLLGEADPLRFGPRIAKARALGLPVVFGDSATDPVGDLEAAAAEGITAGVIWPLMRDGRFVAGFYVCQRAARNWTADEVALIHEVAETTLLAVGRAEALARLERRVDRQEDALARQAGELLQHMKGRSAAESQLRQLQKMEAVGQLTGGIAHDFNNMLAVIIGGLNLLQRRLERGDTNVGKYVDAAMEGATRAASLTQRLLAFSRQAPLAPEPLDVNDMVDGIAQLLDHTLGERVELKMLPGRNIGRILADSSQLENALINLAVNARDAMPDGGCLTILTDHARLGKDEAANQDMAPGGYVLIAVSDTGIGMSDEVLARAFDPFFTTKGVGKGTGLGLSQVFGFVRQTGGHVRISSAVGHGTTVRIYLPRFFGDAASVEAARPANASRGGTAGEVILVVEDEEKLRVFTVEALREAGYTVIHAAGGAEALAIIDSGRHVTLLFTDIVMPGMTGHELAAAAVARLPDLKLLYTTGYAGEAADDPAANDGENILRKPFGIGELEARVRHVLDAPTPPR